MYFINTFATLPLLSANPLHVGAIHHESIGGVKLVSGIKASGINASGMKPASGIVGVKNDTGVIVLYVVYCRCST